MDTASNYRGGMSEDLLGQLLTGRRDQVCTSPRLSESGATGEHPILAATGEGDRAESRVFRWNAVTQVPVAD